MTFDFIDESPTFLKRNTKNILLGLSLVTQLTTLGLFGYFVYSVSGVANTVENDMNNLTSTFAAICQELNTHVVKGMCSV